MEKSGQVLCRIRMSITFRTVNAATVAILIFTVLAFGCATSHQFSNPALRAQYERDFENRTLDLVEGFWQGSNEIGEGIGVLYRTDPERNGGFPFAGRGLSGVTRAPKSYVPRDPFQVAFRFKPSESPSIYTGQALMLLPSHSYWEDATLRILEPTTLEIEIHSVRPMMTRNKMQMHLVGPTTELQARLNRKNPSPAEASGNEFTSLGSGFLISSSMVVSSYHVVAEADNILCFVRGTAFPSRIWAQDQNVDLVLLELEKPVPTETPTISLAQLKNTRQGERVFAMGFPLQTVLGHGMRVHEGVVSSTVGINGNATELQIEMSINPGNSGGPILNQWGQAVGVVKSKLGMSYAMKTGTIPEGITFATKTDALQLLLRELEPELKPQGTLTNEPEMSLDQIAERFGGAVVRIEATR